MILGAIMSHIKACQAEGQEARADVLQCVESVSGVLSRWRATAEEGQSKAYADMSKMGRIRTHSERTKNAFHMGFYAVLYTNHFRKPTKMGQSFYECPRPKAL